MWAAWVNVAVYLGFPPLLLAGLARHYGRVGPWLALGLASWAVALPFVMGVPLAAAAAAGGDHRVYVVALAGAAGVFEEVARWGVLRRRVADEARPWAAILVVGAAHGGAESVWFGAFRAWRLLDTLGGGVDPDFATAGGEHLHQALARPVFVSIHVALTGLVWRSVADRRPAWLLAAVAAHTVIDLLFFAQPVLLPEAHWVALVAPVLLLVGAVAILRSVHQRVVRTPPG